MGVATTYPLGSIYNTDETGVYFDDAPGRIIAERGAGKSTKIKGKKQSYRATVLFTVAADGKKLPPLIIYMAKPGGTVEDSFKTHVSDASINAFAELGTDLVPLPINTTAVLQPLDVGVMGPFKQKLRSLAMAAELELLQRQRTSGVPLRQRLLAIRRKTAELKQKAIAAKVIRA